MLPRNIPHIYAKATKLIFLGKCSISPDKNCAVIYIQKVYMQGFFCLSAQELVSERVGTKLETLCCGEKPSQGAGRLPQPRGIL